MAFFAKTLFFLHAAAAQESESQAISGCSFSYVKSCDSSSLPLLTPRENELLAPLLKGLVILGDTKNCYSSGLEKLEGFHAFGLSHCEETEELSALVEKTYLNHPLDKERLQKLKGMVSNLCSKKEGPAPVILTPCQDLSNGILLFIIAEAPKSDGRAGTKNRLSSTEGTMHLNENPEAERSPAAGHRERKEGEIAVADDAFPKLPSPPPSFPLQDEIMIPHLNALVLVGSFQEIRKEGIEHLDGIFVVDVNIPGGAQKLREEMTPLFIGKPLTQHGLQDLKKRLLAYFKSRKMPVVAIQIPQQEITGGVLQLLVIQGKLGKVRAAGNRWTSSERLESYVRLKSGDDIDENYVISDLAFMNRNPFRRTDVIYTPGALPGTTDIELLTEDRRPFRLFVGAENTGVKPTDRERLLAGFNWGNVFGFDHVFSYQYTASPDFHKFQAHTIQYSAPLPIRHVLVLFGGVSFVHPKIPFPKLRSHGYGVQGSLRYDIPLKPTQSYLHELSLGFDFKRTNNTVEFSEGPVIFGNNVNLTQLVFGYNGAWERAASKTTLDGELLFSPGRWLPDQANRNFQSLRTFSKNNYIYGKLECTHIIKILSGCSLSLLGKGQLANRNLLPSEEFGLGGYDSVRGYDEREQNADNALLLSGELRTPVWHLIKRVNRKPKDELQLLLFTDFGLGGSHKRVPDEPHTVYLLGAGPGIRYMINPFLSARADFGIKLHRDRKTLGAGRSRLHFAIIGSF